MNTYILDAGHGMGNRRKGRHDPGAVSNGITEAEIAMDWVNELRGILMKAGKRVIRTRVDATDPAPIGQRAAIAKQYKGEFMLSLHCNAANGRASGTETFYRGANHKQKAQEITDVVCAALGTRNRGAKTEAQSQHTSLAIMAFQPCFLLEIGFIDNASNRAKMLDPVLRKKACEAIAKAIT